MNRPAVLIPGDDPVMIADSPHLDRLRERCDVRLYRERPADAAELIHRADGAVAVINSRGLIHWPRAVLGELPQLRMITACGIGVDAIDVAAARELGIVVCNVPGRTAPIIAEHALALMLDVARRVSFQTAELRAGRWTKLDNVYLAGKTLGVVGAGPIGRQMIRLGKAIGMNVIAWTFHPDPRRSEETGVSFVELNELLAASDVVTLHLRLTDKSRGLIGRREIERMKPGAILVNTARGAIVDTTALVDALKSGRLGGAGIDVFDVEPLPPDHPLLSCEHVAMTPHSADQNPEGMDLLNSGAIDNVLAYLDGRPQNVVA